MTKTTLYFDGSSHPHTKEPASYGYVLETACEITDTGFIPTKLYEGTEKEMELPQTSNSAEYVSLIQGLRKAIELGVSDLTIYGDSQVIIYQITGKYRSKKPHLTILRDMALKLLDKIPSWEIEWVKRDKNKADRVSRVT